MRALVLMTLLICTWAQARLPKTVPLLPPRETGNSVGSNKKSVQLSDRQKNNLLASVDLGMLMRSDSTSSDLLGMQLFWGGRLSVRFPIGVPAFYLKPSLGYFFKKQSEGAVSVFQHVIEGGLSAQYGVINQGQFQWLLGVSNRLDLSISTINVYNQSTSGNGFRYRVGPNSGIQISITREIKFTSDFEMTFSVSGPTRVFGGLTSGLAFEL
ncbi:MAG: hypothetical protein ACKOA8_11745 [Deltaproteobacteria bacterium]